MKRAHFQPRRPAKLRRLGALAATFASLACDVEGNVGYWTSTNTPPPFAAAGSSAEAGHAALSPDPSMPSSDAGVASAQPMQNRDGGPTRGEPLDVGMARPTDLCELSRSASSLFDVTITDPNAVVYNFANGANLPAGHYQISYVDGCRKYNDTEAWTLHASVLAAFLSEQGRGGCYLIVSNGQALELAPGTSGLIVGAGGDPAGAFASYAECVAANHKQEPRDLMFAGGPLGIMNAGDSTPDKTPGEAVGGRSPTYRLTRLDPCP